MLIVTVFVIVSLALRSMGMNYIISPSLAVWLPLMIFVPLAMLIGGPLRR
jgi:lipopolysaccharide export LptBFGC system permease protein LptF